MRRKVDLVLGVGLLASLTLNGALLVRDHSSTTGPTGSSSPPTTAGPVPCSSTGDPTRPSPGEAGPSATLSKPGDFDDEVRDPAWATAQEAAIEAHLADMLPEPLDLAVECRSRCCAISGKAALSPALVLDLQASAGLLPWAENLQFSNRVIACFDRASAKRPPTELARRRKEILARLQSAVAACARLTAVPVEVTVVVGFDTRGEIIGTSRQGELSGSEAAGCAEKAIADSASFGPQPLPGGIPFVVRMVPGT